MSVLIEVESLHHWQEIEGVRQFTQFNIPRS